MATMPFLPTGHYGNAFWIGDAGPSAVHFEVYGDFSCPFTKKAWPAIKQVTESGFRQIVAKIRQM